MGTYNVLPPDHETEELIRQYFSNTGALFPYIHQASFMDTYNYLKQNNFRTPVRRTYLGLLNMVLAMAAWSESGRRTVTSSGYGSDLFFQRAQELCKKQIMRGASLETGKLGRFGMRIVSRTDFPVQFLLLSSQYLQGTQKSSQTWAIHGLATKIAMSIGIHSSEVLSKLPEIEQEMGKRAWFGCVVLDRYV
jgi:hypothetical protein